MINLKNLHLNGFEGISQNQFEVYLKRPTREP